MPRDAVSTHGDLTVCGRCGDIKGPVPGTAAVQPCGCASKEQYQAQPRYGKDFPKWLELCRTCGLRTVSSGSRWSHYHCGRCRPRVVALNELLGRCVVPQGRHSLMNGISMDNAVDRHPVAFAAFADQLQNFFDSTADLEAWGAQVVLNHLAVLGFDPGADVILGNYLGEAHRAGLRCEDRFAALVQEALPREDCSGLVMACLPRPPLGLRAGKALYDREGESLDSGGEI